MSTFRFEWLAFPFNALAAGHNSANFAGLIFKYMCVKEIMELK